MKARAFLPFVISLAIGCLLAIFSLYFSGSFNFFEPTEYGALADAMTLPAVLLIGAGALILISRSGFFDVLSYATTRLVGILAPFFGRTDERFYDFKLKKRRVSFISGAAPLFVGVAFLFFALLFLFLFYF